MVEADMRIWLPLCLGLAAACGPRLANPEARPEGPPEQAFSEAIRVICEVDRRAAIADDVDPLERAEKRNDYLSEHVKNPDAIEIRTLWSVKMPSEQAKELRQKAAQTGLGDCALAAALERED